MRLAAATLPVETALRFFAEMVTTGRLPSTEAVVPDVSTGPLAGARHTTCTSAPVTDSTWTPRDTERTAPVVVNPLTCTVAGPVRSPAGTLSAPSADPDEPVVIVPTLTSGSTNTFTAVFGA